MREGFIGDQVKLLQVKLRDAGFPIPADGWFGPATEAALIAFQKRAGLVADGIAGPKTLQALDTSDRHPRHLSEADLQRAAARLQERGDLEPAGHEGTLVPDLGLDRIPKRVRCAGRCGRR